MLKAKSRISRCHFINLLLKQGYSALLLFLCLNTDISMFDTKCCLNLTINLDDAIN